MSGKMKFGQRVRVVKKAVLITIVLTAAAGLHGVNEAPANDAETELQIECPVMEQAVRRAINKPEGKLTRADVREITRVMTIPVDGMVESLEGIQYLSNLGDLFLNGADKLADASILVELERLQSLAIFGFQSLEDFSFLDQLDALEILTFQDGDLDLKNLPFLPNVTWLNLRSCGLKDISGLSELFPNLGRLDLRNAWRGSTNKIEDFSPLTGNENLQHLDISNMGIEDISSLPLLPHLLQINLRDNPCGPSIVKQTKAGENPLKVLQHTGFIELYNINLTDLSPITVLTGCRSLDVSKNPIKNVSALAAMTWLTAVSINDCHVQDLSPLAGLDNLVHLSARGNLIEDIAPLAGLPRLSALHLNDNRIRDITPLAECRQLRFVGLRGNKVEDISPLVKNAEAGGLGKGSRIDLRDNPLSEKALEDVLRLEEKGVAVQL